MADSLGDIAGKKASWSAILDTLMPGGDNWTLYARHHQCRDDCPGWNNCSVGGPDRHVCTSDWRLSESNPLILRVVRHVLQNFAFYDQGDSNVVNKEKEARALLAKINSVVDSASEGEYAEGDEKLRLHKYRERNSKAAKDKKNAAIAKGYLRCESCRTDYLSIFSKAEALRIVECHHKKPLASLKFSGITKSGDLALLCANCHRIVHSTNPPLTIASVRRKQVRANNRLQATPKIRRA